MTPEDLELVIQGAAKVSDAAMRELRTPGAATHEADSRWQWEALLALASGVELLASRALGEMTRPPVVRPCPACAEDEDLCPHRQARAVLALRVPPNELDAGTVREYLAFVLRRQWRNNNGPGPDPWLTLGWNGIVREALAETDLASGPWCAPEANVEALMDDVWRYLAAGG